MAFKKIAALFSVFFILVFLLSAQEEGAEKKPPCLEGKTGSPLLFAAPHSTLVSGEEIEISGDGEGADLSLVFRYGALSSGPVVVEAAGNVFGWEIRVKDEEGKLLVHAPGGGSGIRAAADLEAGDEILIHLEGRKGEGSGELRLTLLEINRADGEKRVRDAVEKATALYERARDEKNRNRLEKAGELVRQSLSVMEEEPGCRQSAPAADLLWEIGIAFWNLRDMERVRRAWQPVMRYREATLRSDDQDLLAVRKFLANAHFHLGDFESARVLFEKVLEVYEQKLDPDDFELQKARGSLANALNYLGDHETARALNEKVLDVFERTLSPNDFALQKVRLNLASILTILGEFDYARTLYRQALGVFEETFPPGHPNLQKARLSYGDFLSMLGDLSGARPIQEKALKVYEENLDPEDPELQNARIGLAKTLFYLGDLPGARALLEQVVEVYEETLPPLHPLLQQARENLAAAMASFGDLDGARTVLEGVVEIYKKSLPPESCFFLNASVNLAETLRQLGELEEARTLLEEVLRIREEILSPDHLDVLRARENLAAVTGDLGDLEEARVLLENVLAARKRTLPVYHSCHFNTLRRLADVVKLLDDHDESARLSLAALEGALEFTSRRARAGAVREIEESARACRSVLDLYLSFGREGAFSDKESFLAAENFRAAGARAGKIRRNIAMKGGEEIKKLYKELALASLKVTSSRSGDFIGALRERDKVEQALAGALGNLSEGKETLGRMCMEDIILSPGWAAVSFLRYTLKKYPERDGESCDEIPSYLAFVLSGDGEAVRIELGPAGPIDEALGCWRKCISRPTGGADEEGRRARKILKKRIWDPISDKLGGAEKVVVAPDSLLATIPLEALPLERGVIADRYTLAYVDSLSFLAVSGGEDSGTTLVALGGADYDAAPVRHRAGPAGEDEGPGEMAALFSRAGFSSSPRGSDDAAPCFLPGTIEEASAVSDLFFEVFREKAVLLQGAGASKASLISLAPRARYLHVATHGYFAPERIRSTIDGVRGKGKGIVSTMEEKVMGLAPSVLCGLRLAGCNRPREGVEDPGVITAEEIQGLDLSDCRLAVLSACESNVGLIREGQGIMSLQRSLGIAGARGTVTTLWKVDDEATKLFFTEFYRLLWKEGMSPAEALQEVKLAMLHGRILPGKEGAERGPREPKKTAEKPADYTDPFYWASFVYWGAVE